MSLLVGKFRRTVFIFISWGLFGGLLDARCIVFEATAVKCLQYCYSFRYIFVFITRIFLKHFVYFRDEFSYELQYSLSNFLSFPPIIFYPIWKEYNSNLINFYQQLTNLVHINIFFESVTKLFFGDPQNNIWCFFYRFLQNYFRHIIHLLFSSLKLKIFSCLLLCFQSVTHNYSQHTLLFTL